MPEPVACASRPALHDFFWPRAVAVFGASDDITILRGKLIDVLLQHAYAGPIHPIHPSRSEVRGLKAYPALSALPEPVDLALIAVPPDKVLAIVEECAAHGVKGVVIFTSGFAEEGGDSAALQTRMSEIARRTGLMICGPNGIGFFNLRGKLACTFSPSASLSEGLAEHIHRADGRIGIVAQSGGLSFALFNRGLRRRLGFSYVVSTGNEASLEAADFARYLLDEGHTDVVLMFLETVRDAGRLVDMARHAADAGKPIVVAKIGRSEAGSRAAASHTASLTGSDSAYDAVFAHYGLQRVDDQEEMLDAAAAFAMCPLPAGERVAVVTTSGGAGGWMADACAQVGLALPQLDAATQARIRTRVPSYGSADNPVDTTAQGVEGFTEVIEMVLASETVDAVVMVAPLAIRTRLPVDGERLKAAVRAHGKPVLAYSYTLPSDAAWDLMRDAGVPVYETFTGCARALRALVDHAAFLRDWQAAPALPQAIDPDRAARVEALLPAGREVLVEHEAKALLAACGFDLAPEFLARSAPEAVTRAAEVRRATGAAAVALKIQSPAIPHKSDAGGVVLGLSSPQEVEAGFHRILAAASAYDSAAAIDGVLVQPMLPSGVEMLAGFVVDPTLGPIVTIGMGGIFAEVLADVASAPAPLDAVQVHRLLARLKGYPLLCGARGRPAADIDALADFLVRLSRLAVDSAGRITAFDVNPLHVHPRGGGVTIIDAGAVLAAR